MRRKRTFALVIVPFYRVVRTAGFKIGLHEIDLSHRGCGPSAAGLSWLWIHWETAVVVGVTGRSSWSRSMEVVVIVVMVVVMVVVRTGQKTFKRKRGTKESDSGRALLCGYGIIVVWACV